MELAGYIASLLIGLLLGLLGGGGSILSIPILIYLFRIETTLASAYSLFIVGTTSFVGAIPKYREQLINLRAGFLFSIPSVFAIFITRRWIVPSIPKVILSSGSFVLTDRMLLLGIFSVLMIMASVSMIWRKKESGNAVGSYRVPLTVAEGLLIGLLTGLVGAGCGFLIIPALVFLTGLRMKIASGTSLLIIAVNSLFGFAGDLMTRNMDWVFLLTVTAVAIVGVHFGNVLSRRFSNIALRKTFGWLILIMGTFILLRELLFLG